MVKVLFKGLISYFKVITSIFLPFLLLLAAYLRLFPPACALLD